MQVVAGHPRQLQVNDGLARLYVDYAPEQLTEEVRRRAQARANTLEAKAKKRAANRTSLGVAALKHT